MTTKFMVNGEEKTLEMRDARGIDWSGDFIGNTSHGMASDDEGRYVVDAETFEWWQDMIAQWQRMESTISEYKERFDSDEVTEIVNDAMGGYDLEDQPRNVIEALEEMFGDR